MATLAGSALSSKINALQKVTHRFASTKTTMARASCALKAVPRPALAPAATSTRQFGQLRPNTVPARGASLAPSGRWALTAERQAGSDREQPAEELHRN